MGVAIPGGQHNLGYSGAHNIRGSVILNKNNPNKCHLYRDMGGVADGNRQKWTFSAWVKVRPEATSRDLMGAGDDSGTNDYIMFQSGNKLRMSFCNINLLFSQ